MKPVQERTRYIEQTYVSDNIWVNTGNTIEPPSPPNMASIDLQPPSSDPSPSSSASHERPSWSSDLETIGGGYTRGNEPTNSWDVYGSSPHLAHQDLSTRPPATGPKAPGTVLLPDPLPMDKVAKVVRSVTDIKLDAFETSKDGISLNLLVIQVHFKCNIDLKVHDALRMRLVGAYKHLELKLKEASALPGISEVVRISGPTVGRVCQGAGNVGGAFSRGAWRGFTHELTGKELSKNAGQCLGSAAFLRLIDLKKGDTVKGVTYDIAVDTATSTLMEGVMGGVGEGVKEVVVTSVGSNVLEKVPGGIVGKGVVGVGRITTAFFTEKTWGAFGKKAASIGGEFAVDTGLNLGVGALATGAFGAATGGTGFVIAVGVGATVEGVKWGGKKIGSAIWPKAPQAAVASPPRPVDYSWIDPRQVSRAIYEQARQEQVFPFPRTQLFTAGGIEIVKMPNPQVVRQVFQDVLPSLPELAKKMGQQSLFQIPPHVFAHMKI